MYIRAGIKDTVAQVKEKIAGFGSTQQSTVHDVVLRTEWNYPVEQYTGTAVAKLEVPKHTKPAGMRLYMKVSFIYLRIYIYIREDDIGQSRQPHYTKV